MTVLFLDFDGVLHPPEVHNTTDGPELMTPGRLFMHAHILQEILGYHPEVRIVLSTSWVGRLGFDRTKAYLPPKLQARVIGTTHRDTRQVGTYSFDSRDRMTRFQQIWRNVYRQQIENWVALDDLHGSTEVWPAGFEDHLILCSGTMGLGDLDVQAALNTALMERQWD